MSESDDLIPVKLPSGAEHLVYRLEMGYFTSLVKRYLTDNAATNISDLQDLDRIVVMETMLWRWGTWLSQRSDYLFDPIDEKDIGRQMKDISMEVRQLKSSLGIDKLTREKESGAGSVPDYLDKLRQRAKAFGIMRETQVDKALELFHELAAKMTLHDNANEREAAELKITTEDLLDWIRKEAIPEFNAIDEHFRSKEGGQASWIRSQ